MIDFHLETRSGVPTYLQLVQQVRQAVRLGVLKPGDQLPTVKEVVGTLAINPNTVLRAYREMEIRGIVDTQQGTGTFIASRKIEQSKAERDRALAQLTSEFVSRAGAGGFTLQDLMDSLREFQSEAGKKRR